MPEYAAFAAASLAAKGACSAPGRMGLRNLGNTCYWNSLLQAIGHTPPMCDLFFAWKPPAFTGAPVTAVELLRERLGRPELPADWPAPQCLPLQRLLLAAAEAGPRAAPSQRASGRKRRSAPSESAGSAGSADTADGGAEDARGSQADLDLWQDLHAVFSRMWMPQQTAIFTPETALMTMWRKLPQFSGFQQRDAEEFWGALLQHLDKGPAAEPRQSSPWKRICRGEMEHCVECRGCGARSVRRQAFFGRLSVPFPTRVYSQPHTTSRRRGGPPVTLHDCLEELLVDDVLEGASQYFCERCACKQDAVKSCRLGALPDCFAVHFCRSAFNARGPFKVQSHVHIPLETIDFARYTAAGSAAAGAGTRYKCTAVVEHSGRGVRAGHYMAYGYNTQLAQWYLFNDHQVKAVSPEVVGKAQAYMAFFARETLVGDDAAAARASAAAMEAVPCSVAAQVGGAGGGSGSKRARLG